MQFAIQTDSGLVFEEVRGRFTCRRFVTAEYLAVQDIVARNVQTDIRHFSEHSRLLELRQVHDPFDGFHDPSDFPSYGAAGGPR